MSFHVEGTADSSTPVTRLVAVEGGSAKTSFRVRTTPVDGKATVFVTAEAGGFKDSVRKEVRIIGPGFPVHVARSGIVAGEVSFEIAVPEAPTRSSLHAELSLHLSPVADIEAALAGLLREPSGCFEQTSSVNYPNVLALNLLQRGGTGDARLLSRARDLVAKGYRRLAAFECPRRGYEWFGADPGHEALTAYGLIQFVDMKVVLEIDDTMVDRTRQWLLDRRDGDGGYTLNPRNLDTFGGAPEATTSAYVTYALLESGQDASTLAPEIDRLATRAIESADAYEVALAASALQRSGRHAAAGTARARLREMQAADGSLTGKATITRSSGDDLRIETTSFAILAWLDDPGDHAAVARGLEWILSRRSAGRFGATQATVMALKALCASVRTTAVAPGTVVLSVNDAVVRETDIGTDSPGLVRFEGLESFLRPGSNVIRLALSDGREIPWAFNLRYAATTPASDPDATIAIETRLASGDMRQGDAVTLTTIIENRADVASPMVVAVVGIPAGLAAQHVILDDLKRAGRIDFWELDGRELVLYWRSLPARERRSLVIETVASMPGKTSGPASRAWLYYTPAAKSWAPPLSTRVD